ncbi:tetratricopeptide repeat protein [Microvirga tunisiensis]|uniref:Tetratricopeptide repeat protein n=2 Tax=Pannonibacter tanglangensis TaxID=2750084 RepID=A0A7X5F0V8_9HYPH|nr:MULTISPECIES: tetratricopeptide repeat protein [unclassified Pannonibacter]NBN64070.1 tetratricopeptide repeat protein [Pannonibacter sp. XCT-34]NBN77711.1 tetratricopeptide repeat protein [Pannonibacter sp. XCT-53]
MSDIFREVDEDIRHEKYRRLWDRFGVYVIILAVLVVVGTAGYRGWLYWEGQQAQKAGDTFMAAVRAADAGNSAEAQTLFESLAQSTGGYPVLARMRAATDLARQGNEAEALARFDAIAADSSADPLLRGLAAIRAGYIALDSADYATVAGRLQPLAANDNPWRFAAREILAFSAWKQGDLTAAQSWVDQIAGDAAAPRDIAGRVGLLNDLIRAATGKAPAAAGVSN